MKRLFLAVMVALTVTGCQNKKPPTQDGASVYQYDPKRTQLDEDAFWDSIHKADFDSVKKAKAEYAKMDKPIIKFDNPGYDFGKVKAGTKVTHEFSFKNVGTLPLIITYASATCGCTVPEYSKEPIKPGEGGTIKVVFNSTGKVGKQNKNVTIFYNNKVEPSVQIFLNGEVEK